MYRYVLFTRLDGAVRSDVWCRHVSHGILYVTDGRVGRHQRHLFATVSGVLKHRKLARLKVFWLAVGNVKSRKFSQISVRARKGKYNENEEI